MTTTACDDQFSAEPEPVHQPYDVAAILRKNIADLEKELQRQREQNAALRADADRIDWLADVNNTVGSVVLPREIVESNISSLRQAIDAARSAKITQEPAL